MRRSVKPWAPGKMIKASDIRSQKFSSADKILLDANIWLFLQGPQGDPHDWRIKIYSQALANMIAAKCQIVIDALVVSEFINRFARIHFDIARQADNQLKFKDFRNSADFKQIATDIADEVRSIFSICNRVECGFSTLNDADLLNEFGQGDSDFNDLIITDICRTNSYTLVTHDADFCGANLPVLTANIKLLKG
jgi:hypothetical protein